MGHSQEGIGKVTATATGFGTRKEKKRVTKHIREAGMGGFHQHLRGNDLGDDPNTEIISWKCGAAGDSILQSWQCPGDPTCDSVHSQNCLCGTRNNKFEQKLWQKQYG